MAGTMGTLIHKKYIEGEAQDIETIVRLRSWIEDEWRSTHGNFRKTNLVTDYNAESNIFKFKLYFTK